MYTFEGALPDKLPDAGITIFAVMSALAHEHDAVNLSQGFPNFPVAPELIELVNRKMKEGYNQYAPLPGILPLRERIAEKMSRLYGADYDPESEVTVTAGGTQAIFTAIMATIQKGDEVILFEPAYDCYAPAVRLAGGTSIHLHLHEPGYHIDWEEVRRAVNPRTRMIILNTPQNPAGSVLGEADIRALESLTDGTDIVILSDEVYEHVIFDDRVHHSMARYPALARRSYIVYSFGKTYHATGWKTGYVVAPANMTAIFRKVHQFNVFAVNGALQHAFAEFMLDSSRYTGLAAFYQQKRDAFLSYMKGSRFEALPCAGSYFLLFDYSAISDEPDTEYAKRLTREHKVASVPVSVFYKHPPDRKLLRFCFAKDDRTLQAAAGKLKNL